MAGQFKLLFTDEELQGDILPRPTLGDLRDRINALVADEVPLDARAITFYNASQIRTEVGFEKPVSLEPETDETLLDRYCDPATTSDNRALIRAELLRRLAL